MPALGVYYLVCLVGFFSPFCSVFNHQAVTTATSDPPRYLCHGEGRPLSARRGRPGRAAAHRRPPGRVRGKGSVTGRQQLQQVPGGDKGQSCRGLPAAGRRGAGREGGGRVTAVRGGERGGRPRGGAGCPPAAILSRGEPRGRRAPAEVGAGPGATGSGWSDLSSGAAAVWRETKRLGTALSHRGTFPPGLRERLPGLLGDRLAAGGGGGSSRSACCCGPGPEEEREVPVNLPAGWRSSAAGG